MLFLKFAIFFNFFKTIKNVLCNKFNGREAYNTDNRLAKSNLKPRRTSAYMQGVRVRNVLKHVNRTISPQL